MGVVDLAEKVLGGDQAGLDAFLPDIAEAETDGLHRVAQAFELEAEDVDVVDGAEVGGAGFFHAVHGAIDGIAGGIGEGAPAGGEDATEGLFPTPAEHAGGPFRGEGLEGLVGGVPAPGGFAGEALEGEFGGAGGGAGCVGENLELHVQVSGFAGGAPDDAEPLGEAFAIPG